MTDKVLTEFFNSKNVTVDETVITDLVALENQYLNKISIESEQKGIKKAQADIQNQIADAKALAKKEAEQEFASKLQNEVTKVKQDSEKTVAERTLESKSAADAYQKQLEEIKAQLNVVKAQSDNIVGKNLILEKLGKVDDASYSDILKLTTQPIGTQE
jgi:esterase/lipase